MNLKKFITSEARVDFSPKNPSILIQHEMKMFQRIKRKEHAWIIIKAAPKIMLKVAENPILLPEYSRPRISRTN